MSSSASLNHSISHALGSKCPIPRKPNETIAEALGLEPGGQKTELRVGAHRCGRPPWVPVLVVVIKLIVRVYRAQAIKNANKGEVVQLAQPQEPPSGGIRMAGRGRRQGRAV